MNKFTKFFITVCLAVSLVACGGGSGGGITSGGGGGGQSDGNSGSESISVGDLLIRANKDKIQANGRDTAEITVVVKDKNNVLLEGVDVKLDINSKKYDLRVLDRKTDSNGELKATLTSGNSFEAGEVVVTATAGGISTQKRFEFTAAVDLLIEADKFLIQADGSDKAEITVTVKDKNNLPLEGVDVSLAVDPDKYNLIVDRLKTDSNGKLTATLSSGNSFEAGEAVVTATAGGISKELRFVFSDSASVGDLLIEADKRQIQANGIDAAQITVTVTNKNNVPLEGINVNLTIDPKNKYKFTVDGDGKTDSNGKLTATLTSGNSFEAGEAVVTATAGGISKELHFEFTAAVDLLIEADKFLIQADGSDKAEITVTVKDKNNLPLEGVDVNLTVDPNKYNLLVGGRKTDSNGKLTATLSSGKSRDVGEAFVTATAGGISEEQFFMFIGTSLSASPSSVNFALGDEQTVTLTARDGYGKPIPHQTICIEELPSLIETKDTKAHNSCQNSLTTDNKGQAKLKLTAVKVGEGSIRAISPAPLEIPVTVTSFRFIEPEEDQAIATGTEVSVRIEATGYNGPVKISTSSGILTASNTSSNPITVTADNTVEATLSGFGSGKITLYAEKDDGSGEHNTVRFFAYDGSALDPSTAQITVEVEPRVLAAGSGAEAIITAKAWRDSSKKEPVPPNTLIRFTMDNPLDSSITNLIAYTDNKGKATTRFIAGDTASGNDGVKIKACIVDIDKCGDGKVVIKDKPGSLSIGISNEVESVNEDTAYRLPISVIATDINGNALANRTISLSVWPVEYAYDKGGGNLEWLPNEDVNRNVIRDLTDEWSEGRIRCTSSGEKIDPNESNKSQWAFDNQCTLLPPHTSAGTLPKTVTTDENGLATFSLIYLKGHSRHVKVELRASTEVDGTETQATRTFVLPHDPEEENLPDSPFNIYFE